MNLFEHPDYGTDLKRQFLNAQVTDETKVAIQSHLSGIAEQLVVSEFFSVDHERKRINLMYSADQETLTMALTACPVGIPYEVYFMGRLLGKGAYWGVTSKRGKVSINADFMPEEPLETITTEIKLD